MKTTILFFSAVTFSNGIGDGIFDKMKNKEIIQSIWTCEDNSRDFHKFTGNAVDSLMRDVFINRSSDNLSIILVTFENFFNMYTGKHCPIFLKY